MRHLFVLAAVVVSTAPGLAMAEEFAFFNILKDGKATKEQVARHCAAPDGVVRAFSVASLNLTLTEFHERVRYKDRQFTNINASPGEWNGEVYAVAEKTGPTARGTGHAAVILALGTGDEISTHSLSADNKPRHFERIQLTSHRVMHIPELATDFDLTLWEADRAESEKVRSAPKGGN